MNSSASPFSIQQERALDALGNPVRRQLLAMIAAAPHSVGELASSFPISRPAISRHLALLEQAGFIAHDTSGTRNIYRPCTDGFAVTRQWLDGFWDKAEARLRLAAENLDDQERDL